ncbi:MAG: ATP-dependent Clp protease adaptor ClpS [Saprospiraceae bacterium]
MIKIHYSLMGQHNQEVDDDVMVDEIIDSGQIAQLIVYNDDFNTFDWVIQCFMEVLNHSQEQSEQLSLLVHFKGKASVKTGPKNLLIPLKDALVERGLSAIIESVADSPKL